MMTFSAFSRLCSAGGCWAAGPAGWLAVVLGGGHTAAAAWNFRFVRIILGLSSSFSRIVHQPRYIIPTHVIIMHDPTTHHHRSQITLWLFWLLAIYVAYIVAQSIHIVASLLALHESLCLTRWIPSTRPLISASTRWQRNFASNHHCLHGPSLDVYWHIVTPAYVSMQRR